ncbi:MAG: hypothetical protein V4773_30985 [Verrucomicrobiota bacterium]
MNLDDLMAVWRTQDAAPLHDVNKTLLHLALRQEEAKLQKARRIERWMVYVFSAGAVAGMALFFSMMVYFHRYRPEKVVTGWDFALPIFGAAAALFAGFTMYVGHRAQARREERFGESLRDQLNRRIAQLDYAATRARRTSVLVIVLLGGICPAAIMQLGMRVNDKSIGDDGYSIFPFILCVWSVVLGVWTIRHQARAVLPRKRRLEALLKELDGQE